MSQCGDFWKLCKQLFSIVDVRDAPAGGVGLSHALLTMKGDTVSSHCIMPLEERQNNTHHLLPSAKKKIQQKGQIPKNNNDCILMNHWEFISFDYSWYIDPCEAETLL